MSTRGETDYGEVDSDARCGRWVDAPVEDDLVGIDVARKPSSPERKASTRRCALVTSRAR